MITEIRFQNFKSLRDFSCSLSRLTVIVGPNASGKTSVLQGINYLSLVSRHRTPIEILDVFAGPNSFDFLHSSDGSRRMLLSCFTREDGFNFSATKQERKTSRKSLPNSQWEAQTWLSPRGSKAHLPVHRIADNNASKEIAAVAFLQFEPRILASASYSSELYPNIVSNGEGLASTVASIALSRPEVFEVVQSNLRQIVPHFQRIRFRRVKIVRDESEIIRIGEEAITRKVAREYPADELLFDFDQRQEIPAANVSEGTILALGLLTVLHGSFSPRIILLDDIEKGLHPNAQRELIGMLREILKRQPDLQIVATSHSPYFLDFLDSTEVRLMAIDPDGFSRCGLLTDHPDFPKWKDEMTPGEMWSFFGEKWLVEEKV